MGESVSELMTLPGIGIGVFSTIILVIVIIFIRFMYSSKKQIPVPVKAGDSDELINNQELVAVITAAIEATATQTSSISKDKLIVRSIKRVGKHR